MRNSLLKYFLLLSAFFFILPFANAQNRKEDSKPSEVQQIYKASFNQSVINKSIDLNTKGLLKPKNGKTINVLVASPDAADFNTHVLATMQAFGGVNYTVTLDLGALTVSDMLNNYDVVWTFNVKKWETETGTTPVDWSNKLGSFIDGGGFLLESQFVQSYDEWGLGSGTYITGNKSPFTKATLDRPTATFALGNIAQPGHPIMAGVAALSTDYFVQDVTVRSGATLICSWNNSFTDPLVAVYDNIVAVNANPLKSSGTVTSPGLTGDGYKMFHNAIVWLYNNQAPQGAPAAVTGLNVTAGALGALSATIEWTNPTLTAQGEALTELSEIKIFRNDPLVAIHTIPSPVIGAVGSWVDNDAPAGNNVYYVVASNTAGDGPSSSMAAWIGPDVPAAVSGLVLTAEGQGGRLNWTEPTTGLHGGYFDPAGLAYQIVRNPGNVVIETNATGNTYFDNTITELGTYSYTITAKNANGNGGVATSNSVLLHAEGLIQIGDGTVVNQSLPIEPYYGYTYSQSIFLQSEINVANKRITKVFYQYNGNSAWTDQIEVYMAHTSLSALTGYLPGASLQKVYEGPLAVTTTPGWIEIVLQTPFNYNNTDNLLVAVIEKTPGYHASADEFFCTATPGGAVMSVEKHNDTTPYSITSPPTASGTDLKAYRPNIRLFTQDIPVVAEINVSPTALSFGTVQVTAMSTKTFTIYNTGGADLIVNNISVSDDVNYSVESLTYPLSINVGSSLVVSVTFNPTSTGLKEATLTVVIDPEIEGTKVVALTGNAIPKGLLNETFEGLTAFPPAGWRVINGGGANTWVLYSTDNITPAGSKCAAISYNTAAHNDWLITPQLRVTEEFKTLKFWTKNGSTSFIDEFNLKLSTTGNDEANFTTTLLANVAPPNVWKDYTVDLTDYVGQTIYIAFQAISADKLRLMIDDVSGIIINLNAKDIEAVSIAGSPNPSVGVDAVYNVTVRNKGLEPVAGGDYTVSIYKEVEGDDELLGTVNGVNLGYQQQAVIPWTANFASEGSIKIYAVVNYDDDENLVDNTTPSINVTVFSASTVFVELGTGTDLNNTMPWNFFYKSSLSQTIYKGSEIGIAGPITHLVYKNNFATNLPDKPVKIWLGNSDKTDLTDGWIPANQLTLVYEGTLNFPIGVNEIWIELPEVFIFEGGNLVVMALRPMDAAYFSSSDRFFVTTGPTAFRTRTQNSDSAEPDPNSPTGTVNSTIYPNIKMAFNMAGMGTLAGTVTDDLTGDPIEGAKVQVDGSTRYTLTNADGEYNLPYLFTGDYDITISKHGYYDFQSNVTIEEDLTTTLDAELEKLPFIEITGTVVRGDDNMVAVEGATVVLEGYENFETTTDENGIFIFEEVYGDKAYSLTISKTGFTNYVSEVTTNSTDINLGTIELFEIAYPPINLTATINNDNEVELSWMQFDPSATTEFRYDDGTVSGQLGFTSGTAQGVMGSVFRRNAQILEVTWQTTSNGGPHNTVNVFILALNESGMPTGTVLYSAMNVPNVDGQWSTHVLPEPVNAPNGFMLALSYTGFLGLAIDNATEPWVFQNNTHFYNANYTSGAFSTLESASFTKNFLLRAIGYDYGPLAKSQMPNFATTKTSKTDAISGSYLPKVIPAGDPVFETKPQTGNSKVFESYNIYRAKFYGVMKPDIWESVATGVTELSYTDNTWAALGWGVYKYAVKAVYTNNNLSEPAISGELLKDMFVPVTINVSTNGSDVPVGAIVQLEESDGTHTYTLTAPTGGVVLFTEVWRGQYDITVTLPGHEVFTALNVNFSNATNEFDVELVEIIVPPYNLAVTTEGLPAGNAQFVWNTDNSVFDDVEGQTDFAINNAAPWTILDLDGLNTYGANATNFPGESGPIGFIVFNNATCDPSVASLPEWQAASGNKYFASIAANSTTVSNNDWLISPELEFNNAFVFRFKAKSITDQYGLERFKVGYSTTTNAPAAFTFVTAAPYATAPISWTEFTYNIPANAKYVAINCVSLDAFIFMVDDLYIGPAAKANGSKAFVGYNIYLDGNLVVTEQPETEYMFSGLSAGTYTAGVQSVYTSGNSSIEEIDFDVPESYGATFTVTNAITTDFIQNATVTIMQGDVQVAMLNTDANGYSDVELYVGEYSYSVSMNGFETVTGAFEIVDQSIDIDVELEPYFNLTFTVVNENSVPVNDAVITINGTSMAAGVYSMQVIRGEYTYSVQRATYDTVTGNVEIVDQDVEVPVTLVYTRYSVTFNVTSGGVTLPDAIVTFNGVAYNPNEYVISNILPGTYAYSVVKDGYKTVTGNVTVVAANVTVPVNMLQYYTVTFAVNNTSTEPLVGATILINGVTEPLTTNESGEATIELVNGNYSFSVSFNEYQAYTSNFTVNNANLSVPVVLFHVGIIDGTLTSVALYPNPFSNVITISNATLLSRVVVTNLIGQRVLEVQLNQSSNGKIETESLPAGVYLIKLYSTSGEESVRKMIKR